MAKKKPIVITIKETRHKRRPWTYTIDKPGTGPMETKQERYSRIWTAKRGALRQLGAYQKSIRWVGCFRSKQSAGPLLVSMRQTEIPIEWRIERLTKTKSKK